MRILVTGAAGFVGSEVVRSLVAEGRQITAIDRDQGFPDRLAATLPAVKAIALDLERREEGAAVLQEMGAEGRGHLGRDGNPGGYLVGRANLASLGATIALVEAALASGCRKIVMGGSCVEYALQDRPLVGTDP